MHGLCLDYSIWSRLPGAVIGARREPFCPAQCDSKLWNRIMYTLMSEIIDDDDDDDDDDEYAFKKT